MNIKTFIDRPILSVMLSIVIVIIGIIGLKSLPLEQYPDIAPPTVKVNATYVGANAETVMKSVATPLEASINGVENMLYMTSTAANNGTCTITIYFKQGSDPNMAVVNVQNRVASAQGLLPAEVTKSGVTVRKTQNSNLKFITLYSPDGRYDSKTLTNYMKINIEPQLSRIAGVGEVNVFGADYALRIWLNPAKMHAYGLVPADIDNALAAQNIESPMGALAAESDNTFQYVLKYRGRYSDASEFRNIVIKASADGGVLRLGDVARVELGTVDYNMKSTTNGKPGASASITQTAGTNANDIVKQIDKVEDDVRQSLPDGMILEDQTSVMDFLNASMHNVTDTLVIALVLVVIVARKFADALRKRPEIGKAHYTFNMDYPQYSVEVDAARCMMKNVSPGDVLATMSAYIGGDYASNINKYTKLYRVMVQSEATGRLNERALDNMFVRSADETMSPLSEFVTLKKVNGAEYLTHFNLFPAIRINGTAADGYSSGQAIRAISEVAAQTLPNGYGYELGGLSREESSQGNATIVILAISIVFVYIILCCLYESLLIPFAVILVVPFGLCGSFLLSSLYGIDNSIYMQIGLVMLIGMLAKTGILLTEYATERRKAGESIISATLSAASVRLRPIIMTASVMIIGMMPMMLAHGAGARGNAAIGTCVVGGMVVGTMAIIFLLPVLYCIFETWDEKIRQRK